MKAQLIKNGIYSVGAVDYNIRSFHGYNTMRGVTYNSYLIIDDKITLIDGVKATFSAEQIERISSVIDISKIDYIISNHAEYDHTGSFAVLKTLCPNAKFVTSSPMGEKALRIMYGDLPFITVKAGDTLNIGKRTLSFVPTPMVHWPDNMVTYSAFDKILFSNDAFGQHYATAERFDSEVDMDIALAEAQKYFANIVMPYVNQASKAVDSLGGLALDMIAPSHGVVWTAGIPKIMALYNKIISHAVDDTAVIVYDSMWGNTEKLARQIADSLISKVNRVLVYNVSATHNADIMTQIMFCKYLIVGSPTLNNNMLPTISSFLCYLKGLNPTGKKYFTFGSFGWAGGSIKQMEEILSGMGYAQIIPPISVNLTPSQQFLATIPDKIAEAIK